MDEERPEDWARIEYTCVCGASFYRSFPEQRRCARCGEPKAMSAAHAQLNEIEEIALKKSTHPQEVREVIAQIREEFDRPMTAVERAEIVEALDAEALDAEAKPEASFAAFFSDQLERLPLTASERARFDADLDEAEFAEAKPERSR